MTVYITDMARYEVEQAYEWLAKRSLYAATKWKAGLLLSITKLERLAKSCPLAPEAHVLGFELRQLIHGKRRGRYRILFEIRSDEVYVLRVRHGAQDLLEKVEW